LGFATEMAGMMVPRDELKLAVCRNLFEYANL
jgi:hypothetical protein